MFGNKKDIFLLLWSEKKRPEPGISTKPAPNALRARAERPRRPLRTRPPPSPLKGLSRGHQAAAPEPGETPAAHSRRAPPGKQAAKDASARQQTLKNTKNRQKIIKCRFLFLLKNTKYT